MSSPAPVPSKAAIHALRGLIFGTSCSIVLLAEERRRRIRIARSAVENGRKLRALKCYSTAGTATLEALRDEASTDSTFFGSPPFAFYTHTPQHTTRHSRPIVKPTAHSPENEALTDDLGPDPRRPRETIKQPKAQAPSSTEAKISPRVPATRSPSAFRQGLTPTEEEQIIYGPLRQRRQDWSDDYSGPPLTSPSSRSNALIKGRRARAKAVTTALEEFWAYTDAEPPVKIFLQRLGLDPNRQQSNPGTTKVALDLVRRAYDAVKDSAELPRWLFHVAHLLSATCQRANDHKTAASILSILVSHGPIEESDYLAHHPLDTVDRLLFNLNSHPTEEARQRLDLSAQILFADLSNDTCSRAGRRGANGALNLVMHLFRRRHTDEAVEAFRRAQSICGLGHSSTKSFIRQVRHHRRHLHHLDSIDALIGLSEASLQTAGIPHSDAIFSQAFRSLFVTRGYRALDVIRAMRKLQGPNGFYLEPKWVLPIIERFWRSARNLQQVKLLYGEIYDVDGIREHQPFHNLIVRILLEANELNSAQAVFEELCAQFPGAKTDIRLIGGFARFHAAAGHCDGARKIIERMNHCRPFTRLQQNDYDITCRSVIRSFAAKHTWGETEVLIETYVEGLWATVDDYLANMLVDRHVKCRDAMALIQWLQFCGAQGLAADASFWKSLFTKCVKLWYYDKPQLYSLFDDVNQHFDIEREFPGARQFIIDLAAQEVRQVRVLTPLRQQSVVDERATFERLKADAHGRRWHSVIETYQGATHNGMGYSSRCHRLAVEAAVQVHGAASTEVTSMIEMVRSAGHDVSKAVIPLALAELGEILDHGTEAAKDSEAQGGPYEGRPYAAIQELFHRLREDGITIDDAIYNKAAKVCLDLRSYGSAISVCLQAADANGSRDPCYTFHNFSHLCVAYASKHDYRDLERLLEGLQLREYRSSSSCIRTLKRTSKHLRKASEADKAPHLQASDMVMARHIENVLAKILEEKNGTQAKAQEFELMADPFSIIAESAIHPIEKTRRRRGLTKRA